MKQGAWQGCCIARLHRESARVLNQDAISSDLESEPQYSDSADMRMAAMYAVYTVQGQPCKHGAQSMTEPGNDK